ncbi:hypothetical protein ATANTOWER_020513 [Ataeniobius toweri]|uniref:Uncharacterized protein n=1 Tax=Ataeniobius toweri TaxID=208326 RepID=A0ABU7BHA3_9TELE|nr:hypothetical protein [Ataeniobius toweri]
MLKLCSREFPAESLSLQHRVERFSRSEGRAKVQHSTPLCVQFGLASQEPPHPTATGLSCSLTLCLPTRGCFPQRPGQVIFSMVHIRGGVWAEKISLELKNLNNVRLLTFVFVKKLGYIKC